MAPAPLAVARPAYAGAALRAAGRHVALLRARAPADGLLQPARHDPCRPWTRTDDLRRRAQDHRHHGRRPPDALNEPAPTGHTMSPTDDVAPDLAPWSSLAAQLDLAGPTLEAAAALA